MHPSLAEQLKALGFKETTKDVRRMQPSLITVSLFVDMEGMEKGMAVLWRNHHPILDHKGVMLKPKWRKHKVPNKSLREHPFMGNRLMAMPPLEAAEFLPM